MGNVLAEQNNQKSNQRTNEQLNTSTQQQYTNLNLVNKLTNATKSASMTSTYVKTPQVKCDEIGNELHKLQHDVHTFAGQKGDKAYLSLDEMLTRCLLKLDEIDRSDDDVNQQRKNLISFTHELADELEKKSAQSVENNQQSSALALAQPNTSHGLNSNETNNSNIV